MKKNLIASLVLVGVLVVGILVGGLVLNSLHNARKPLIEEETFEIIVDDEINIYTGQDNSIYPCVISNNGTVKPGRFDYTVTVNGQASNDITIDSDGNVKINKIPSGSTCAIITDRNTGSTKTIKLNIIEKLESVLGIIAPDGNLVLGPQELIVNNTYAITIVTVPNGKPIGDYCTVKVLNAEGEEKEIFDVSYDGDKVLLTVQGIGEGTVYFNVVNDDNQKIHESHIEFVSSLDDKELTQRILTQQNKTLIDKNDVKSIKEFVVDKTIKDLGGLEFLSELKTIYIEGDQVLAFENASSEFEYRVSEAAYYSYYNSSAWQELNKQLYPCDSEKSGVYVVYHSSKHTSVMYEKVYNSFELMTFDAVGYKNTAWLDEQGNKVTSGNVSALNGNGIHLYAEWTPITYKVVYNVRYFSDAQTLETWTYDEIRQVKNAPDLNPSVKRDGYRFAGWTTNSGLSIFTSNISYKKGVEYSNLASNQDDTIYLYDVWEPIEYTIAFQSDIADAEKIESKTVKYGEEYFLPSGICKGYNFRHWVDQNGNIYNQGTTNESLTIVDGAEIILKAKFEEIKYTVTFRLNGGTATANPSFVDGFSKTISYNEQYTIPGIYRSGYVAYSWECGTNQKSYGPGTTLYKEFDTDCEVEFVANWTEAVYTINYYYNGISESVSRVWNDGRSLKSVSKEGYTFKGWSDRDRGTFYEVNCSKWSGNLIDSAAENGKVYNLEAVFDPKQYDVTFKVNSGETVTQSSKTVTFGSSYGNLPTASKVGSTFSYWVDETGARVNASTNVTIPRDHYLYPVFSEINYTITRQNDTNGSHASITYKAGVTTSGSTTNSNYEKIVKFTLSKSSSAPETGSCDYKVKVTCGNTEISVSLSDGVYSFKMPAGNVTITLSCGSDHSCFASGTMIMMADGTTKPIEEIKSGDLVMSWNFITGTYEPMPVSMFWYHGTGEFDVIYLNFEKDVTVKVITTHGFFDYDLNEFVYITSDNYQSYIGHSFVHFEGAEYDLLKLESVEVKTEYTGCYSLRTACNDNAIAEGMLSLTAEDEPGFLTYFEVGDNLKYDEKMMQADIEAYGLFTYEEWAHLVSYEEFVAFNGQYYKILIGKGIITEDQIYTLLEGMREVQENRQ